MRTRRADADKSRYGVALHEPLVERLRLGIVFLVKGLVIGLAIAAPLGPIGILCMNRTLLEGTRMGFICGLGAAAADAVYALAGALALAAIGLWIIDDTALLQVMGGVFLVYLGARTFMRPALVLPAPGRRPAPLVPGAHAAFMSTWRVALANPLNLLGFAAVFAGLGLAPTGTVASAAGAAASLVLGVFLGSTLWWLALSGLGDPLRHHINARSLSVINRVSGTLLTAFGLYAMTSLLSLLPLL